MVIIKNSASEYWIKKTPDSQDYKYIIGKNNKNILIIHGDIATKIFTLMSWQNETLQIQDFNTVNCHGTADWLLNSHIKKIIRGKSAKELPQTIQTKECQNKKILATPHFIQLCDESIPFIAHSFISIGFDKTQNSPIIFEKEGYYYPFRIQSMTSALKDYSHYFHLKSLPILNGINSINIQ